jgi:hypothetical protein
MKSFFVRAQDVVARRIAGEVVLVPIRRRVGDLESVFTLNAVGSRIWELCDGTRGAWAVAAALAEEFTVSAEEAARDVQAFLAHMQEAGLMEEVAARVVPQAE